MNDVVGIDSDSSARIPMNALLCILVTAAVFCLAKLEIDSFQIFGDKYTEKDLNFIVEKREAIMFYFLSVFGCLAICFANTLKKHSAKAIVSLLAVYGLWFGWHYRQVCLGAIHAGNRAFYGIIRFLSDYSFESTDPKAEMFFFLYAVVFGAGFILAYLGVRRCSAFWFTVAVIGCTAVPLALDCMDGEVCFVALAIICILMYTVKVQGYRRASVNNTVTSSRKTIRIGGKYSAFSAFEQTAVLLACSIAISGIMFIFGDSQSFERSEKAQKLGEDIMYSIEDIASGTFFESLGFGNSSRLNNGQLSRLNNLDYTGRTMFDVKCDNKDNPLYLRSFSAADYNGKRWSKISRRTYRSYDFWEDFSDSGFYPQFFYPCAAEYIENPYTAYELTIKNKAINRKLFLTEYRMFPELTKDALSKSSYRYDGNFTFDRFGGEYNYKQTVLTPNNYFYVYCQSNFTDNGGARESVLNLIRSGDFDALSYSSIAPDPTAEALYGENNEDFRRREALYREFAAENYSDIPDNIGEWLPEDFDSEMQSFIELASYGDGFDIDLYYDYVVEYIGDFLSENAEYTLQPGRMPSGRDFTEYFVNENKKGFCVHFATAAALMLRRAGIPARYSEGYYVSTDDLNTTNSGYTHVRDSRGHAWAEVYYPLKGWQVKEFTPSYMNGSVPDENRQSDKQSNDAQPSDTDSETDTETDSGTDTETDTDTQTDTDSNTDKQTDSANDELPETITPQTPIAPKSPSKLLMALFSVLRVIGLILLIIAAWLALRYAVLKIRNMRFNRKDRRKAALAMYFYSLRILWLIGIKRSRTEGEEKFAVRASGLLGADGKSFKKFTKTALSARYGKKAPKKDQTAEMREYVAVLTQKMYSLMPKWKKLIIKYLLFFD